MTIDYPDLELIIGGKYLQEITSLFAMRYISSNEEPVKIPQAQYKDWCEKNGKEIGAQLKQLARDGAKINMLQYYLKIPTAMLDQEKDNGQTWRVWATSNPKGANFRNLILRFEGDFAVLRPGHFWPNAESISYFAGFDYVEFIA
jgi:hypothetical protein